MPAYTVPPPTTEVRTFALHRRSRAPQEKADAPARLIAKAALDRNLESDFMRSIWAFYRLDAELSGLKSMTEDWDTYGASRPNEEAIESAGAVLGSLQREGLLVPTKLLASAEGGVGICFVEGSRYAHIEILNEGGPASVVMFETATDLRTAGEPLISEADVSSKENLTQISRDIREHLYR